MKVGIICAVNRELSPFIPHMQNMVTSKKAMVTIYEGDMEGTQTAVLFCGVCKVNAAIAAQVLIDHYQVDILINAGTAGGIDPQLQVFDTVVSTEVFYHDVEEGILTEYHPWMESVYFKADENLLRTARKIFESNSQIWFGKMATGEQFIQGEKRKELMENFQALSADMETAAIAHVCYVRNIPFIAIRTITDIGKGDHLDQSQFEENCSRASEIAKDATLALLKTLRQGR